MAHKTIILVHGRSLKPPREPLEVLWKEALRFGLERDHSAPVVRKFDNATIEFVYYGNHSNKFLGDPLFDDSARRRKSLERLKRWKRADFNKKKNYNSLPGKASWKESLADAFGGPLALLGVSSFLIGTVAPDMNQYWNFDARFGTDVRFQMIWPLKNAMDRGDDICVISHSLGSLISYDTFWKFSRTGEYRGGPNNSVQTDYSQKHIDFWITLGSPLADGTVKGNLKGATLNGPRRYPDNIKRWVNVAAEDDYISYDQGVENDYQDMRDQGLIESIRDIRIYNLGMSFNRKTRKWYSNPHNELGYLIHPEVAQLVAGWL